MKGEVVYSYAFDVANEIVLPRIGSVLGQTGQQMRLDLKRGAPKDVAFHRPWEIDIAEIGLTIRGRPLRCQIHIYEMGVVNIGLRAPFDVANLDALAPLRQPTLDDGRALDQVASELCSRAVADLGAAIVKPSPLPEPEAYAVFRVTELEDDVVDWRVQERANIAGLLCGIPANRLSEAQIAETFRLQWTLERDDLVVIDWDAALLIDPKRVADDVLYVLEVANLQLEEFRTMDRELDRYLNQAYVDLERRQGWSLLGPRTSILRNLRWFRVDLTKLADEVTNITKFLGDWYLARVYLGACERFHLDRWRGSVEGRLGQLDRLYSVVQSEVFDRRMLWLEFIIVVLFIIDLLALLLKR